MALGAALVAAVAAAVSLNYVVAAAVLLAGAALAFFLRKREARENAVPLRYGELEGEAAERFAAVGRAVEALGAAEAVWNVDEEPGESDGVAVGPASFAANRRPVEVGRLDTPGFSADVEVWGIKTGDLGLFFLPECVLVYEDGRYRAVSYGSFGATYRPSRVAEGGEVPGDAEVVGETWRYVRPGGGPDPRRPSNPRYSLVAYGLLNLTGVVGTAGAKPRTKRQAAPGVRLIVSNRAAAVRFARAFGVGRGEEVGHDADTAREARARRNAEAEVERAGSLYRVLGLEVGASRAEVSAAYREKARMYHPDRVANLAPEVREMAELRMKEINAAYGELKRRG